MFQLIQNECLKLHAKKGIYTLLSVLVALEVVGTLATWKWGKGDEFKGSYLDFVNAEIGLIVLFATIFGITLAARTLTDEFQKGTIKQLLIRPRKRAIVLFSKYITVLLAMIGIICVGLFIAMIIGGIVMDHSSTEITLVIIVKKILYQLVSSFFFATVAFFLANIFRKSVLPLIITLFLYFLQSVITMILMTFAKGFTKFVVFFHLNLAVYDRNPFINQGMAPTFSEFTFATSFLLVIAYFVVLLLASSLLFQKRDVL
ncbi:ABC transporter permease [Bacillus thuringiensis]|uniref:ABC transporter permease n=1 Tax=Bacillus thuringiensis TaxID=1428 RepID=UPI000BF9AFC0|nr:ABC transporter permease [Bacillus thuringiensis]PFB50575.1 ABC transporter permease [Bacillus thuringiensis]